MAMDRTPNHKKRNFLSNLKDFKNFKEEKLPFVIAGVAALLILIFIIGSISLAVSRGKANKRLERQEEYTQQQNHKRWTQMAEELSAKADRQMAGGDFDGALETLRSFDGDPALYTAVKDRIETCEEAKKHLVAWEDPGQIPNLSFQLLIADSNRAFNYPDYASSISKNFVTTQEFSAMLQELYAGGYVLVDLEDVMEMQPGEDGAATYTPKTLYLPEGRKPLMLTQTNVNYNLYLVDSDGDGLADKDGGGFASKLIVDANGNLTNEMVDAEGNVVTGDFDLVPVLEKFIEENPGFSYKDARATLALTGYNGLFGYRTNNGEGKAEAKQVADALTAKGYKLAFYTYGNIPYGNSGAPEIQLDLQKWQQEVEPILGKLDTIVFAQNSDIGSRDAYAGDKFNLLYGNGFRYYIGFAEDGSAWAESYSSYVRQGRIMVSGSNMKDHAQWFASMFDATKILTDSRGDEPIK